MGGNCPAGEYWDALVKRCVHCRMVCNQQKSQIITKCTSYCVSAHCKALPGHYYDGLLKKCLRCAKVCGRHPAECSQHCKSLSSHDWMAESPSIPTRPVTTKKLLVKVTSQIPNSRGLVVSTALEDSTVLVYSLLALCLVLLLSSLSLGLAVLLRGARSRTSKQRPKAANHTHERVVQPGQEVGQLGGQLGPSSKDFVTNSSRPADREPLEDSSPTETCVCVHCFPDLSALGQSNDRSLRAPFSFYQQAVLQRPQDQKGGPIWTEQSLYTSGPQVQHEAAVG